MAKNEGKKFENQFKEDFLKITNSSLDRIYDPGFGMRGIKNICDFIGYVQPRGYYLECKSKKGNTFPINNLTQYEKLITKVGIPGITVGVILWFIDHDRVVFIPISTFTQLIKDGKKSFNYKYIESKEYFCVEIPSKKKRKFLDSDYSILTTLDDKESQ